ncbi:MAG: biuret amidohydrolase [Pseudomonadota bacterium]|jgi:nicotinamidase-related amidase|nr:biuret amidohydrolase [Pseudomonadota bacterium]
MSKALILIDYINEICHPEGKIAGCAAMINQRQIVTKVNKLLEQARKHNCLIIWVSVAFDTNYLEANQNSPIFSRAKSFQALQRNSWGTELLADLNYQAGELIIVKNAVNPFHATNLEHVLRNNAVTEVYLAGVSTEVAIQSCTRDAHDRGYIVNLIGDCCASSHLDFHNSSLEMLKLMAKVVTSTDELF